MKIKSLFIAAQEINSGSLLVSMGMMEILKRKLHRVAFFRPIILNKQIRDEDIYFMLQHYKLDMKYEDAYGFDLEYVEKMITSNKFNELIDQLIHKFKNLEKKYDFVLCEGIRKSFFNLNINFDVNLAVAQNFNAPYINIINAKNKTSQELYKTLLLESKAINTTDCIHFATFLNRVETQQKEFLQSKQTNLTIYYLQELEELSLISIQDVLDSLGAQPIFLSAKDRTRSIRSIKIAALSVDNFLTQIEEEDLVIVPADRSDIILGLLAALYSSSYPNISCIVFPFSMHAHPNIEKLIRGLDSFNIPILSVVTDTYETAKAIQNVHSRIRPTSDRKIALSLGLFNASVTIANIENKIETQTGDIMTPMMFRYKLFDMASSTKRTIVLPESSDERILRAAEIVISRGVAEIIFLGDEELVKQHYLRLGLNLSSAIIINPLTSPLLNLFIDKFYTMRKKKGLTKEAAKDAMLHVNYFGTMMVELGYADGMVSGSMHSTGDTIRPALQIIKTKENISSVSSIFFMCFKTKVLVYGDCAINLNPDAETLADIALASVETAKKFEIEAKIAMLSYSTGNSGSGADVNKVKKATQILQKKFPSLLVDGPIQYDAAVNKDIAKKKLPDSKIAGDARIFIFPDLNTGNNTYKAVQRSSGAVAIGPILQGLKKPINDLSRGCLVEDIVNTIAITAIQVGEKV